MTIITIDPGIEGAICIEKKGRYYLYPMPLIKNKRQFSIDYKKIVQILKKYKKENPKCFIESQFRSQKTVDHCGILKGILIGLDLEFEAIHPATWSSKIKVLFTPDLKIKKDKELETLEKKTPNKYRNVIICKTLFPKVKINNEFWANKYNLTLKRKLNHADGLADSLLINYYVNNFISQ